jgi:nitrogen fixation NifU-like protein
MNELYQQMIIHHSRHPFGQGDVNVGSYSRGSNPLCGDQIACAVALNDDQKISIKHQTKGCSLSIASASIMSKVLEGKTIEDFEKMKDTFMQAALTDAEFIGKFACFNGVKAFPMRIKCITFPWHAVQQAILQLSYPLILDPSAIQYWSQIVKSQMATGIKVDFKQIGCYGWKFDASIVQKHLRNQLVYDYSDWKMFLEQDILEQVTGTKVLYQQEDSLTKKIIYQHPKASAMCGCGESIFLE